MNERVTGQEILKFTEAGLAETSGLSRAERRKSKKGVKKVKRMLPALEKGVSGLDSVEDVFDNKDEIGLLRVELSHYRQSASYFRALVGVYGLYESWGVTEPTIRALAFDGLDPMALSKMRAEIDQRKMKKTRAEYDRYLRQVNSVHEVYVSEELEQLGRAGFPIGVNVSDTYRDIVRSTQAGADLLEMELTYLLDEKKRKEKKERQKQKEAVEAEKGSAS